MRRGNRTSRRALVALLLLSLLAPLVLTVTGTSARALFAPEINLSTTPAAGFPTRIARFDPDDPPPSFEDCVAAGGDPAGNDCHNVTLAVSATAPLEDVTVTVVERRGLYVDPVVTTIDALETDTTVILHYVGPTGRV